VAQHHSVPAPVRTVSGIRLVGMGNSGAAPSGGYRFVDYQRYLDAWFEALEIDTNVILVVHDWGSALGFSWAQRHQRSVKALVYMEVIVRPFLSWAESPDATRVFLQAQRTPGGEDLILRKNLFIEYLLQHVLPKGCVKVRYYGLFSPSSRKQLDRAHQLLRSAAATASSSPVPPSADVLSSTDPPWPAPRQCPHCRIGYLILSETLSPQRSRSP
jgi:pimeloyl-ACP methyl ester carboxylesterase